MSLSGLHIRILALFSHSRHGHKLGGLKQQCVVVHFRGSGAQTGSKQPSRGFEECLFPRLFQLLGVACLPRLMIPFLHLKAGTSGSSDPPLSSELSLTTARTMALIYLFFLSFCLCLGRSRGTRRFPGQGSNQSCSHRPAAQPQ